MYSGVLRGNYTGHTSEQQGPDVVLQLRKLLKLVLRIVVVSVGCALCCFAGQGTLMYASIPV